MKTKILSTVSCSDQAPLLIRAIIVLTLNLGTFIFLCKKSQNYELCTEMIDTKVTCIPGLDSAWLTSESTVFSTGRDK